MPIPADQAEKPFLPELPQHYPCHGTAEPHRFDPGAEYVSGQIPAFCAGRYRQTGPHRERTGTCEELRRIQELRFPGLFEYQEQVSAELYDAHIPPLMLQTFIENSVEHGMKRGQKNWIHIQAFYQEQASVPGIAFSIQDNGKGFSEEDLEGFAKDPETFDLSKSHGIGIRNIISRLKLLYNGKASIRFPMPRKAAPKLKSGFHFWIWKETWNMYNLLFVDDDQWIAESMRTILNWEDFSLNPPYIAYGMEQAQEFFKKCPSIS